MTKPALRLLCAACLCSQALAAQEVTISVAVPDVTQYETTHLDIRIVNGTKHVVLLDTLRIADTGVAHSWARQVYGALSYSEGEDAFIHNRMAQMASELRSASAILAPQSQTHCAVPLVLDASGDVELTAVLSYHVIDSDEGAGRIYLPRGVSALEARYTPATMEELAELGDAEGIGQLPTDFATRDLPRPRSARARVAFAVKAGDFPLQDAMQRVGVVAHEFEAGSRAWLLDTKGGLWLVTRERAEFRPGLGAREYHFVSEAKERVPFWFPLEELAEGVRGSVRERIAKYEPQEGMGIRFDVPSGEVMGFAAELHKLGLRLALGDFQLIPMLGIRPIDD